LFVLPVGIVGFLVVQSFTQGDDPLGSWRGPEGEAIDQAVIHDYAAAAHCGWESADILRFASGLVGSSEGDRSQGEEHFYIRDPEGAVAVQTLQPFDASTVLPTNAIDTGHHTSSVQLWLSAADDAAFVVYDDHTERWPRVRGALACG
jgi:hypothetical protein